MRGRGDRRARRRRRHRWAVSADRRGRCGVVVAIVRRCRRSRASPSSARARRLGWIALSVARRRRRRGDRRGRASALTDAGRRRSRRDVVADLCAPGRWRSSFTCCLSCPTGVSRRGRAKSAPALWYARRRSSLGVVLTTPTPRPSRRGRSRSAGASPSRPRLPALRPRYVDSSATGAPADPVARRRARSLALEVIAHRRDPALSRRLATRRRAAPLAAHRARAARALACAARPRLAAHADRLLVHLLSILGSPSSSPAIYLFVVRGSDKAPTDRPDRDLLGGPWLAAAIAAVGYVPGPRALRPDRHQLHLRRPGGARRGRPHLRQPHDPRHPDGRAAACSSSSPCERRCALDLGRDLHRQRRRPRPRRVGPRPTRRARSSSRGNESRSSPAPACRATPGPRCGCPSLADERASGPMRVAPISHAGELLGIIVVSRLEGAVAFSRGGRPRALRPRPPGRPGAPQRPARHRAADLHSTSCVARPTSFGPRALASSRAATPNVDASSATSTTAPSSTSSHWPSTCGSRRTSSPKTPRRRPRCSTSSANAVQETIQELRELAHGIYPPLLVDSGLGEALQGRGEPLAARHRVDHRRHRPLRRRRRGGRLLLLPRGAAERRQARRRPRTSSCACGRSPAACSSKCATTVRASTYARAQRGHGYVNMMDRLGAIGGAVRWESEIGHGTAIRGSVPLD